MITLKKTRKYYTGNDGHHEKPKALSYNHRWGWRSRVNDIYHICKIMEENFRKTTKILQEAHRTSKWSNHNRKSQ